MPKRVPESELSLIVKIVCDFRKPVSLGEILEKGGTGIPQRTLQRRLALLAERGMLRARSSRGGRRYEAGDGVPIAKGRVATGEDQVPLSPAGREIRERMARPLRERRIVGYHAPFPEYYRPNASAYLSTGIRERLHGLGRTSLIALPPGTHFRNELPRLGNDLAWNSSRLSGGSYTLPEMQDLFEKGEFAAGHTAEEAQLLMNHRSAIGYLARDAGNVGFNRHTLCNLHSLLADNLLPDPASGGRLRTDARVVDGSVFQPLKLPQLIESRFDQVLEKAEAIGDPFEQAFFALVHLGYLQPFDALNGRVSRLAANIPMLRHNLIPLTFVDVPRNEYLHGIHGVYELNRIDLLRDVFLHAYERSCARYSAARGNLAQPDPFRLRHRDWLAGVIGQIVRGNLAGTAVAGFVREKSDALGDPDDRVRAPGIIETELACLHEGNIARYQITPSELEQWNGSRDRSAGVGDEARSAEPMKALGS